MIPKRHAIGPMRDGVSSGSTWAIGYSYDTQKLGYVPYLIMEIKYDYGIQKADGHPIFSEGT